MDGINTQKHTQQVSLKHVRRVARQDGSKGQETQYKYQWQLQENTTAISDHPYDPCSPNPPNHLLGTNL